MATIQITVPDAVAPRVADAFAGTFPDAFAASGLTKAQYTKQALIDFIRHTVSSYEANVAAGQAANQARVTANTDIVPT